VGVNRVVTRKDPKGFPKPLGPELCGSEGDR